MVPTSVTGLAAPASRCARIAGIAAALALTATVVTVAATASPALAAPCTKSWNVAGSGDWSNAASWLPTGVPGLTDDVCITVDGTYTVTVDTSRSVASVTLGGTAGTATLRVLGGAASTTFAVANGIAVGAHGALVVDGLAATVGFATVSGGPIVNDGAVTFGGTSSSTRILRANLTNSPSGTVTVSTPNLQQDANTTLSNAGTFTVTAGAAMTVVSTSTFAQAGGSLANGGSLELLGTFDLSGGALSGNAPVVRGTLNDSGGTGAVTLRGNSVLTGTIPAGQTVTVLGVGGASTSTTLGAAGVTNNGTLVLDSTGAGHALVQGGALTNNGTLRFGNGAASPRYLRAPLVNTASGTVLVEGGQVLQDGSTTTTTSGTFTVAATGSLLVSATSTIAHTAGVLANGGSLVVSGTFDQDGGTLSGTAPIVRSGTLDVSGGTGAVTLENASKLRGTVPPTMTVSVLGTTTGASITLDAGGVTNDGTVVVDSTGAGFGQLQGGTLVNNGTLRFGNSSGSQRLLRAPLSNQPGGTVVVQSPALAQDTATSTVNRGLVQIDAAGAWTVTAGSFANATAGTIANSGSLTVQATFDQIGGTTTGNDVVVKGTLNAASGAGRFALEASSTLTGGIAADQVVTVRGSNAQAATVTLAANLVNAGLLRVDSTGGGFASIQGGPLTNSGRIEVGATTASNRFLRTSITNTPTGTIAIDSANTVADTATTLTNQGVLDLGPGARLSLGATASVVSTATATVRHTVGTTPSLITGGAVNLGGSRLAADTVGTPALGSTFTVVSSNVTGTNGSLDFGANAYAVTVNPGSLVLTTDTPFTLTSKLINAFAGILRTQNIGTVVDPTPAASYTATVDWGDGTSSGATVNVNAGGGDVRGSHLWQDPGSYFVTITVTGADGTTRSSTRRATVTIPGPPTVTSVTPASAPRNTTVNLAIRGTNLTNTSVISFSGTLVDVLSTSYVSGTRINALVRVRNAAAVGVRDVTVTTAGGTATCTGCFTVT